MMLSIRVLLITIILAVCGSAQAVCAYGKPSFAEEWGRAKYVLVGRLVDSKVLTSVDDPQGVTAIEYTIDVVRRFKGKSGHRISIRSDNTSSRFNMKSGYSYILFIESDGMGNFVDPCGSSGELSQRSPYK